jgi:hypothetical protein
MNVVWKKEGKGLARTLAGFSRLKRFHPAGHEYVIDAVGFSV